jgi:rod shape-determining protein MreD
MRNYNTIVITIFAAVFLALLPMPEWAAWGRPAWVLMVLIFWAMITPYQVNVGVAWAAGMLLDMLTGTTLGEHALALTIIIYFVYRFRMRINMYPMLQQGFSVFLCVLAYQVILYAVQGVIGQAPQSRLYWLSSLTTVMLWPWLYVIMKDYCRSARIYMTE